MRQADCAIIYHSNELNNDYYVTDIHRDNLFFDLTTKKEEAAVMVHSIARAMTYVLNKNIRKQCKRQGIELMGACSVTRI